MLQKNPSANNNIAMLAYTYCKIWFVDALLNIISLFGVTASRLIIILQYYIDFVQRNCGHKTTCALIQQIVKEMKIFLADCFIFTFAAHFCCT